MEALLAPPHNLASACVHAEAGEIATTAADIPAVTINARAWSSIAGLRACRPLLWVASLSIWGGGGSQ